MRNMVVAALVAGVGLAATPAPAQDRVMAAALQPGEMLLEVEAEGQSWAQPDRATISAGVVTVGKTTAEVLSANVVAVERLMAALKAAGVPARDIQTQQISLEPQYQPSEHGYDQSVIIGYNAGNQVSVSLRDVSRAPEVMAALLNAGANNVNGPDFSLSDDRAAVGSARADAVAKARAEADAYAAAFGMRVGRVLRVSERGYLSAYSDPINVTGSGITAPPPPREIGAVPISVGQMRTAASLWVDFALVPR